MLGIVASSALPDLAHRLDLKPTVEQTPFGAATIYFGSVGGRDIACLLRHGVPSLPPHSINYRANIAALAQVGCESVVATAAVGSLNPARRPPALCLPIQILDFTWGRPSTFFDEEMHCVDFTMPFCERLRSLLREATRAVGEVVVDDVVYACMQGPRFETAAEINMLRTLGADVVGMTLMPEAALAREKGICYASLCVVTNLAAGLEGHHPTSEEVGEMMAARKEVIVNILTEIVQSYADDPDCPCHRAEPR
ncbi:MAG: S-methyl-5'-thioinosine phosphorylase [Armatimonadetes bacterium]|nr:S-methyl-5'-thioinosine phosphorylase [Armatimonadota bacterium]